MDGIWSGYDSANKKINSGTYKFFRKPKIKLRKVQERDIPCIIQIADKELGREYISASALRDSKLLSICAEVKKKIVGIATGKVLNSKEEIQSCKGIDESSIPELKYMSKVGLVGSIAVDQQFKKRGIGTTLLEGCLSQLNRQGAEFIIMVAWKSENMVNIGSIAEKHEFKMRKEIEDFWKEDSLSKNYSCPDCKNPPCTCTAVIYTKCQKSVWTWKG